ncbi:hypothetical protein ABBZ21_18495 [Acinetobacter baumannii]|uniref:hypothetical protein n=1 Tax=Acinetobacter baumannii TaxID=470 RepID=UPI003858E376
MSKRTHLSDHATNTPLYGLVWNKDLTLDDVSEGVALRKNAIEQARKSRPRTAQIEKEIMIAVIILYALILGSFAGLHLYASYTNPDVEHVETHGE